MIEIQSGLGTRADSERFGHPCEQLTCTGNKVGVEVRVEGIRQSEAHPLGDLEITVHIPLRVDDGGPSGFRGTDQIGRIAESFIDELLDEQIGLLARPLLQDQEPPCCCIRYRSSRPLDYLYRCMRGGGEGDY